MAVCRFTNSGDDWYVLVGVARDMILNPRSVAGGFIYTYRLTGGGEKLEFVHKVKLTESQVYVKLFPCYVFLFFLGFLLRMCDNNGRPILSTRY